MSITVNQQTIDSPSMISGIGLHSGKTANMRLITAPVNYGIRFRRTDLPGAPTIAALAENVTGTARGTTIGLDGVYVSTIEHLLAALSALAIDNLLIEIDAEEVPIMDGSAIQFVNEIKSAGIRDLNYPRDFYTIHEDISYYDAERKVLITGSPLQNDSRFNCEVDYNSSTLGVQRTKEYGFENFEEEIARARTFVFLHEMQYLLRSKLIKGGSFENAIVIVDQPIGAEELAELATFFKQPNIKVAPQGILNNTSLRYPDETARHKLLDMIGDVSLVGFRVLGRFTGLRPGHAANVAFAKKLRKRILREKAASQLPRVTTIN